MAKASGKRPPRKPAPRRGTRSKDLRTSTTSRQERALADVTRVLGDVGRPSAVIGGIAVIAWGYARLTTDIDCAIAAPLEGLSEIAEAFLSGGFEEREAGAVEFARGSFTIPIPRVTDLLIYKLVAARPKDLQDAKALLALGHEVDATRVQKTLEAFDEVLETDRAGEWLRLEAWRK